MESNGLKCFFCSLVFVLDFQGWSVSGKASPRSELSPSYSPTCRCSNQETLKPKVSTCACCRVSWPTPSSMATTWRSRASSCHTLSYTPPPPWRTALPWRFGSTTWKKGRQRGETLWNGPCLLGHTTTSPLLHPPSPLLDPPRPPPASLHVIPTPYITTSVTARTTALTGGRAPGIQGWVLAGISSSRAARTATFFSTHHPLCLQLSTQLELVEAPAQVRPTMFLFIHFTLNHKSFCHGRGDTNEDKQ